ncbi:hypothetical protein [Sphingomonas crusticola]|uniref:hypothetical protein n=1 Tax=Sphingomonas crusticola TaxID=1697973 RepID=UPI0013C35CF8|nr:hypothetical protein [Sphingomonas crusticola]
MRKLDLLLVGVPVLWFLGIYARTGQWPYLALPASIILVLPLIFWLRRRDRTASED